MNPPRDLRVAIGFLTRVPVGDVSASGQRTVRLVDAVPWFPIVGAGIGAVQGLIWWLLAGTTSATLAAAVATATMLLVTGAFHHDGLADIADAFGGGWTVDQRFEILKDSRLGTYGTSALTCAIVIEIAAIASMGRADAFRAIVVAAAIGRACALVTMLVAPVAGDGLGASYMRDLSTVPVLVGVAAAVVLAAIFSPVLVVWPVVAAALAALAVVALAVRKIGGVTGDVLGAISVVATLASLVATAALA